MAVRIINADVFDGLAQLADESVHVAVCSPPYHLLRDYGTARWEGGDPACDHVSHRITHGEGMAALGAKYRGGGHKAAEPKPVFYQNICGKCGAVRIDKQIGLEPTFAEHLEVLVRVFREVRRVLRKDGTLWVNYGDGFAGVGKSGGGKDGERRGLNGCGAVATRGKGTWQPPTDGFKQKDLKMMPARLAIALCDDGWYLRSEIIWAKRNCLPESVTDRPTQSHEKIYLLAKRSRYFYDAEAVREPTVSLDPSHPSYRPNSVAISENGRKEFSNKHEMTARAYSAEGRNMRNVWHLATEPNSIEAHFAMMPSTIAERCIKAGTSEKGCCLKCGAPWTRIVERSSVKPVDYEGKHLDSDPNAAGRRMLANARARRQVGEAHDNPFPPPKHLGWQPSCKCEAKIVPCVVLDPFAGAGTTLLVADRLGRDAIGIELSEKNVSMAQKRIVRDSPLFADVTFG